MLLGWGDVAGVYLMLIQKSVFVRLGDLCSWCAVHWKVNIWGDQCTCNKT